MSRPWGEGDGAADARCEGCIGEAIRGGGVGVGLGEARPLQVARCEGERECVGAAAAGAAELACIAGMEPRLARRLEGCEREVVAAREANGPLLSAEAGGTGFGEALTVAAAPAAAAAAARSSCCCFLRAAAAMPAGDARKNEESGADGANRPRDALRSCSVLAIDELGRPRGDSGNRLPSDPVGEVTADFDRLCDGEPSRDDDEEEAATARIG